MGGIFYRKIPINYSTTKHLYMKRNISKEQYRLTFCKRVNITGRYPVYISERTHYILKKAVANMGVFKLSMSTFVENIITEHLEAHEPQIRDIQLEEQERLYPNEDE